MIQQRSWGVNVGHHIAKELQNEGCLLAAVTYKKSMHAFHASQKDVRYEMLISNDAVYENPEMYIKESPKSLSEITEALGIESIWPLVAGSREVTRSYGEKYFFAGRQQMSDDEIIHYIQGAFAYATEIFDTFKPDVIVAPLIAEPSHMILYHLGRMRGIYPVIATDSKVRGVFIVVTSPWEDSGPFFDRIKELNDGIESKNAARAQEYIRRFREKFMPPLWADRFLQVGSLWKRIRSELAPYRLIFQWYVNPNSNCDCVKPLGPTLDCRPPRIILRDHYTKLMRTRAAKKFPYFPPDRVKEYAYYPLQVEPETTLDIMALNFSDQRELIRNIALSLPGGMTLVVKDHPAMLGLRTAEYLEDISRMPNVKLVDYRIPNERLIRSASLVLAPNATAHAEATMYGIPGVQFGRQGTTLKLPNVIRHTDYTTLPARIAEHLRKKFDTAEYEQLLNNFVASAYDVGVETDYSKAWDYGKKEELDAMWRLYRGGIEHVLQKSARDTG